MTIRARLLWLTVGLAVPLILVGFFNLWEAWQASRDQLNESIERQAELAATAFDQWIAAQKQTLVTVSALSQSGDQATLKRYLDSVVETRPHWLDVQIVNPAGEVVLSQTEREKPVPLVSVETLRDEIESNQTLVIVSEQVSNENLRLLSIAMPISNGDFVVARIDGLSVSDVFKQLNLPKENIIAVFGPGNRLIYRNYVSPEQMSLDVSTTPLLSALDNKNTATIEVESPYDKISRVYALARVTSANCIVTIGVPSETLYTPAKDQYWRQFWLSSTIACFAVFLALLIARGIVDPLRLLTDAAREFGSGNLAARARTNGSDTIRELGETFNTMAERIEAREERLKELDTLKSEFVSNVSHELRTPLTTIKTLVRVLQRKDLSESKREEHLQTIEEECNRQTEFVQNLLDVSRIESGAYRLDVVMVDVEQLLSELVEEQMRPAATHNMKLILETSGDSLPPIATDPGHLKRLISNLIENSMKYTPEKGTITVSTQMRGDGIMISVADTGVGIHPEDLPHIFEKFFRGRPLTSDPLLDGRDISLNESGTGLGLNIAKSLSEHIGAKISVESPIDPLGKGSRFNILLPLTFLSENTQEK